MSASPHAPDRPRGEPLVVLGLVFGGWLAMRVLLWQPPFGIPGPKAILAQEGAEGPTDVRAERAVRPTAYIPPLAGPMASDLRPRVPLSVRRRTTAGEAGALAAQENPSTEGIGGEQLLLSAAFAHLKLPPEIAAHVPAGRPTSVLGSEEPLLGRALPQPASSGRWSGDAWLLWRGDGSGPLAAGQSSYGRSQAGAVLRYRLAPPSAHRPVVYVRVTRALAGTRESDLAAGVAVRPFAGLPLSLAGEVRVNDGPAGRELRPAAFAVTDLPPLGLPLGLRAEGYAQGGYVGGHFATAFVDGQGRIDLKAGRSGQAEVRVGAGLWGGAQKDAARLDVGPSATASISLGDARVRAALDYRLRVAGDAAPKSGPALTISAGF